jgi:double-stranded uracil-DNA glycosylase
MTAVARFSPEELAAAKGLTLPDLIAPGLRVLFCGINPGLYSAAAGAHFARPGNRFWKALHQSGWTPRLLDPSEQHLLLDDGIGITNVVSRATTAASELTAQELRAGAEELEDRVNRFQPRTLAVLGVLAYRQAFRRPAAVIGRQQTTIGDTSIWVLPNPSGLQARYQLPELVSWFRQLREGAGEE